jgi:hypothetical protein
MLSTKEIPSDVILNISEHLEMASDILSIALVCRHWSEPGLEVLWSSYEINWVAILSVIIPDLKIEEQSLSVRPNP